MQQNPEQRRLQADRSAIERGAAAVWRKWGPYLSERQWGTVREDYSAGGTPWEYFPHDHARSRAYRWGEDGIAGVSDDQQRLCLGLALWNGRDPILKERLFGLANGEGNHGEDVKEQYFYLDATPTHSYLKMLYKYPQAEFPYDRLVDENRRQGLGVAEFELLDTGIFDGSRYFDVFIEFAKAAPDDVLMLVSVHNRGPDDAELAVLPQVWFRNTWSWDKSEKPSLAATDPPPAGAVDGAVRNACVVAKHRQLGEFRIAADGAPALLFCENETNARRHFGDAAAKGFFKDAFHEFVVAGNQAAVNPARQGTKAGFLFRAKIAPGASARFRLRLSKCALQAERAPASAGGFTDFDAVCAARRREADEFYADLQAGMADADARLVQRQAFAGLIWSKQFYHYDVPRWLRGDPAQPPPPPERCGRRNHDWQHLNNADVISMPDKWEYPWYAAWDLAFHMIPFARIDPAFAKHQLVLLTREWYMHPNGQLPAYEWAFGDVNPPVHAWAAWRVFQIERKQRRSAGEEEFGGDLAFLERVFHKLMLNFTWWVNRKDALGHNIFQGGFLGLDNIGVFDRSKPLPTGGFINQADGTSWMAMYCLNLMRIALELALHNRVYEDIATKFFEHFLSIAEAMNAIGRNDYCANNGVDLWCDEDQFYYDVLTLPDGRTEPLKIRSMVGLIPLFAVETLEPELLAKLPEFTRRLEWYLNYRPDLAALVSHWDEPGLGERRLLSLLRGHRLKALLRRMLDPGEFLSDYGVRALSRFHLDHPYEFPLNGHKLSVRYEPAESDSGAFGGNSNWRGPVWFPVNYLLVESLQKFHHYYGDDFKVECPTGSGKYLTIEAVATELSRRLVRIFLRGKDGKRPVQGAAGARAERVNADEHFRDYIPFHEYFDGDDGRGVGASHQTGWTALAAKLLAARAAERKGAAMLCAAAGWAVNSND